MGWEAIEDYYLNVNLWTNCQNQNLSTSKKEDVKIIDDRVQDISKEAIRSPGTDGYISDH